MSLTLQPSDLSFRRPFNHEVCEILHLKNDNSEPVVFKVKTTAPKQYCVRPNSGRIEPGKDVDVQVLLQAMKEEPPLDAKCKDKFLVQSVAVTGDMKYSNVTSIFEKAPKASIQERKIRVNFLPPDASTINEEDTETSGFTGANGEPPSYHSPGNNYETPAARRWQKSEDTSPTPPPDYIESSKKEPSTPPQSNDDQITSVVANVGAAAPSVAPTSGDELKSQLNDAYSQIQRLKDRLADQELRHRKIPSEVPPAAPPAMQQQQHPSQSTVGGVSVKAVAVLCLLSFLLAYFFF